MVIAIQIIAMILIVIAAIGITQPKFLRTLVRFFMRGKNIYIAAIVRIALAVVLLTGATACDYPWVIILLGILFLAAGITIFAVQKETLDNVLLRFSGYGDWTLRLLMLIPILFGAVILLAA